MVLMVFLYLLLIAIIVWVLWYISKCFFEAANAKGYYSKKYFWLCFLLGFVGYLLVIALPDRGATKQVVLDELPEL